VADPTNCDSATVTIEVTSVPPVIDAVDDEAEVTPAEGLSGGIISNFNVLDNDTLDGVPVDPADVVISSTPTGTLTINSDGTVSVNAETEAGTFTIEYTICEITNPSNCDTATVTIVVASPPLVDAVDDAASVSDAEGIAGGSISGLNIFDNDTLDGDPLNPSEVTLTSTPTGPLTINSDGSVSLAPDTTEGTYTIQYTICEIANPDNCDTATVTVIVRSPANIIVLKVDTFNDENGDGYAQVGETISYAFTVINTGSVPLGNITVTDPLVTVNGGPLQILEPGESDNTTFTATYTITQEDLENGFFANSAFVNAFVPDNGPVGSLSDDPDDPTDVDTDGDGNPDDLTVTDLIESPLQEIDAVDDDYTTIAVDGATGGLVPDSNVLDNDTLNGEAVDPADVLITSTPTGPLTVNSDGTVSVAPGTPNGLYVIDYTICEIANSSNCDTATVTVLVSTVIVDFKIEVNQMVTPNNDGRNDFLFIKDVAFARNNTLRIYNRWGIAVYEGTNYNNQNNVFDGRSRGRSTLSVQDYLPAGVYFYIFEYDLDEERITDSGYLYLSK
jgi:gliding motility-associated-like protein